MAEIFNFYVQDNRSIQFPKANLLEPIMQEDHNVAVWRFRIPKVLNDIDMSEWAWWFVYVNAAGQEFSELLTLVDDIDNPDNFCTADYPIDYGISKTPGDFTFALEADNVDSGGEILNEWHTKTYRHKVDKTLQGNQAQWAETESDVISALIIEVQSKVRQLVGGATPLIANTKSQMTDHDAVYLYTGSEEGESNGYWYYWNGTNFVPGGVYASGIVVDSTPTQGSNNAVSSGGVWDALAGKVDAVTGKGLSANDYTNAEKQKVTDTANALSGKVAKPITSPNGTAGQLLRTNGDGTTEWVSVGLPTDAQTAEAVSDWLDEHPEATTTVQDGSITEAKLHPDVVDMITATGKEVWVDNYETIEAAIADGDIINFTCGKTYEVNNKITINKSCYIKGNGCIFESEPREASTSNPRKMDDGRDTQLYIFDIVHDDVIIENFNAVSESSVYWENGGEIFTNTMSSNVYFVRVSASNVRVSGISTNHLSGAVRIADEVGNTLYSYHDVIVDKITCLDGVINIYIGNVVRCVVSNLTLSNSQAMGDARGHCIYAGRAIRHVSISNFTIYHNGGLFGGLSIHPSSTEDESLCQYVNVSNGVIYSSTEDTFAIQVTWAKNITINNVSVDADNAKSMYVSGTVNNLFVSACDFTGASEVIQHNYQGNQREIVYSNCHIRSSGKSSDFVVLRGLEGVILQHCYIVIRNSGTYTAPVCRLLSTHQTNTSKNGNIVINDCYINVFDDVLMNLFDQETNSANVLVLNNVVIRASTVPTGTQLINNSSIYGKVQIHNVTAENYQTILSPELYGSVEIDSNTTADSDKIRKVVLSNSSRTFPLKKETPNLIALYKTNDTFTIAICLYAVQNCKYITTAIPDVTITKAANSYDVTITNSSAGALFVSIF